MYAEERQHEIVTRAREFGRVSVADLAARYDVTPETIRRDLDALAGRGLLSRVHGGAVPADKLRLGEASVTAREVSSPEEKLAIAQKAIELLPRREGLTLLLDAGTTTARVCGLLPSWVGQVITNSVPAAGQLSAEGERDVWLLGGPVRGITQAVVGASAVETLARLRVDVALLGTNGFSVDHGFSTPDPTEAAIKRAMVACARQSMVLTDAAKHGVDHLVQFAALEDVDTLVTDASLSAGSVEALRAAGLQVELA
ncbi:MAG: DeoR/GlpR family DNA-binding transcription regulator [Propionibacteriaceae bacterium]|nr:DeoR/GlpR family DNA-binding transcription regulator [Propionibacteriaceae bacterium]